MMVYHKQLKSPIPVEPRQLTEWRNRMRVVNAIGLVEKGASVESIALKFGYSNTSSFIAMFKKLTGTTPTSYYRIF